MPPEQANPQTAVTDCLIIGGGPAGLTAALYLARFRRSCLVVDAGSSRAAWIPRSRNYPGFPPGISGNDLLARLREQAAGYGARLEHGQVEHIEPHVEGFSVRYGERSCITRRIILATGIEDRLPDMPDIEPAIHAGKVRLCAICDGYEVDGDNVAVYGEAESAITHAVFLRTFTDRVTVVVHGDQAACEQAIALAEHYAIRVIGDRVESMQPCENGIDLLTCRGERHNFDIIYPSLGARFRSELALQLGLDCDECGGVKVDQHLQTSLRGLYAIGDVTLGLKQISVAIGQAAQAATAVHNSLEANPWGGSRQAADQPGAATARNDNESLPDQP
ncbi:NAD(P)/FAD-dependent oxidoreductase [Stutzerimonas stutzeri]|uniref:NAD(P)/FAD-dependent oxidoreductase n=1 Tax=Stutzerimonas stutzeri TaxID=316 RepID=UPI000F769553|nr:NAD(P)/FAD-dependent oxidoreductase [Stutzerimonas stutzeri]MDH0426178.1 NAD(P)/FAD-dependent oxidoreductase [Stutzerimonas stutzeri]MDI9727218.1 NAD(P)/FAD-dependent oxidoreductase [Stutzerimonas stutzeri]MDI9749768.1 NAD(P)/FAD-dependent oxidoreductase [Stutzerimonas stutzeri]RRV66838.1 NAD(P)/FAD-dependent oxidoreductase [Stutzerimonas stutzeri]